jgi:hypothetical protein
LADSTRCQTYRPLRLAQIVQGDGAIVRREVLPAPACQRVQQSSHQSHIPAQGISKPPSLSSCPLSTYLDRRWAGRGTARESASGSDLDHPDTLPRGYRYSTRTIPPSLHKETKRSHSPKHISGGMDLCFFRTRNLCAVRLEEATTL